MGQISEKVSQIVFRNEKIKIDPHVMVDQAKEVIKDRYDLLKEIILNSSDNLFGDEFVKFMKLQGDGTYRNPCIPTLNEYKNWKKRIETKGKFGNITITLFKQYLIIEDNGSGIPGDYIENRLESYGKLNEIEYTNNTNLHRRGQFSRGLKEAFVALNSNLSKDGKTDGVIKIETAYKDTTKYIATWKGEYHIENGERKFKTIERPVIDTNIRHTFTRITVFYPSGIAFFKEPTEKVLENLQKAIWMQRLCNEHNVVLIDRRTLKKKLREIEPYISYQEITNVIEQEHRIQIPEEENFRILSEYLDVDFLEIFVRIYKLEKRELARLSGKSVLNPTIDLRGIYISDYTTTYGFLPTDNIPGTEHLQGELFIPSLRFFSVLKRGENKAPLPALISTNRKGIYYDHPILQVVREKVMELWNSAVEKEAWKLANSMKQEKDVRTERYTRGIENYMNNIFNEKLELKASIKASGNSKSAFEVSKKGEKWKKAFFGYQFPSQNLSESSVLNTSLKNTVKIHPGKKKEIICYVHRDLYGSVLTNLRVRANTHIIKTEEEEHTTDVHYYQLGRAKPVQKTELVAVKLLLFPSSNAVIGKKYTLSFDLELSSSSKVPELISDKTKLIEKYPDYLINEMSINGDYLSTKVILKFAKQPVGAEFLQITWETGEQYPVTPKRFENQRDAKRGWIITQKQVENKLGKSYLAKVLCRSRFFSGTFDSKYKLHEQSLEFQMLITFSLSCIIAEILTENTEEDADIHLTSHSVQLNKYMKGLLNFIMEGNYLKDLDV